MNEPKRRPFNWRHFFRSTLFGTSLLVVGTVTAHAGLATGTAVTQAILGPTVAACAASIGPQAVFTGVACATGWVAMGVAWILPF